MATRHTDEFCLDAVRIATTSGLTRQQVSSDLGVGLSTLNKWVQKHQHDDLMSGPHEDAEKENKRLRKEVRLLREEREVLKNRSGLGPLVRGGNSLCYRCAMKGRGRSLIGGLSYGGTPLKNVARVLMRT
jgi:transposase